MHPVLRDVLAAAVSTAGAALWTDVFARLVRARRLSSAASRKLIHVTTAPLFLVTVPLYSARPAARAIAACVPAAFSIRLLLAARGFIVDRFACAVARRGYAAPTKDASASQSDEASLAKQSAREAAGGPFWYGIATSAITFFGWRTNRATYVALGMLAFGDGFAELGRWFPIVPWPLPGGWKKKSVGGSLLLIAAGSLGSMALSSAFYRAGVLLETPFQVRPTLRIASACALVEILPFEDNVLVPAVAYIIADRWSVYS